MRTVFDKISEPLSHRVGHGLAKIALAMRQAAWAGGTARGLTPTQAQVLALLAARGELRLSAIAEELAIKAPTASDAVAALVRKNLVHKRTDASDRRAVAIALTAAGAAEASRSGLWPDLLQAVVADLPEDEQAVLLKTLMRMIRGLQQRGAIPVQRMCVTCRYFRPNLHADAGTAEPHHCAYVDAPIGDRHLRIDCADHAAADAPNAAVLWRQFLAPHPNRETSP